MCDIWILNIILKLYMELEDNILKAIAKWKLTEYNVRVLNLWRCITKYHFRFNNTRKTDETCCVLISNECYRVPLELK